MARNLYWLGDDEMATARSTMVADGADRMAGLASVAAATPAVLVKN